MLSLSADDDEDDGKTEGEQDGYRDSTLLLQRNQIKK